MRAVCSLLHFPAGHPGWALPTTLPCGVRTFLDALAGAPRSPGRLVRSKITPIRASFGPDCNGHNSLSKHAGDRNPAGMGRQDPPPVQATQRVQPRLAPPQLHLNCPFMTRLGRNCPPSNSSRASPFFMPTLREGAVHAHRLIPKCRKSFW